MIKRNPRSVPCHKQLTVYSYNTNIDFKEHEYKAKSLTATVLTTWTLALSLMNIQLVSARLSCDLGRLQGRPGACG